VPPFERVFFRFDKRLRKFMPCEDSDPRSSMLATLDAAGACVIPVMGKATFGPDDVRIIGYQLGAGSTMYDPADGLAWLTAKTRGKAL
jgi:hypothetical protein